MEEYLLKKDVKIIYPETLTLEQQIFIVNKYKYIIGCQGSALHNIIFSLNQDIQTVCLTSHNTWLGTFYMIDEIKCIKSHYVTSLEDKNSAIDDCLIDKSINLEATISELEKIGIV